MTLELQAHYQDTITQLEEQLTAKGNKVTEMEEYISYHNEITNKSKDILRTMKRTYVAKLEKKGEEIATLTKENFHLDAELK